MYRTNVSTKGQVVIPAEIREQLHLEPGTSVTIDVLDGAVRMVPLTAETIRRCKGMFSSRKDVLKEFKKERNREDAARDRKFRRWIGK